MANNLPTTHLEILFKVSRELAASLDLHEVLTRVLTLATSNIGAERASLIVLNPSAKAVDAVNLYDGKISPNKSHTITAILKHGLAGWVMRNRQAIILPNTHQDPRWLIRHNRDEPPDPPKSALCLPLLAQEQLVGILTIVHPQVDFFTVEDLNLQQAIAAIAAIAIRNANLFDEAGRARALYQGLFEQSADPIFITTLKGRILEANYQALVLSEYSRGELLSMKLSELDPLTQEQLSRLSPGDTSKTSVQYNSSMRSKNKSSHPVEVGAVLVSFRNQAAIQWIYHDISARQQLDHLRDDLAAMLYHDLRSPLANIITSLELIGDTLPIDRSSQLEQLVDIANRSGAHMQRLTSSLLDINRLEAGQPITNRSQVNLANLVDEALEIIAPLLRSRNQSWVKNIPSHLPLVSMDADMILRVLINLLENACNYSPVKSTITVSIATEKTRLHCRVEDQGKGVPAEARERIFEKFTTLQSADGIRGLGLGLAFCRLAVQAHGGTIWMEENFRSGSAFIFSLPLDAQE